MTEELLRREGFFNGVWDPAAGAGHITDVVRNMVGGLVLASDIEPDAESVTFADFLSPTAIYVGPENIITNPPFGAGGRLAMQFIGRALDLTLKQGGKVAMLLPLTYDAGKTRQHVFGRCPQFAGKYVLTQRIRWANLEQKESGPMENHAWHLWDWRKNPATDAFVRYI